jgi:mono/diheme cytochrome c family protein
MTAKQAPFLGLLALATTACGDRAPATPRSFDPGPVPAEFTAGQTAFERTCAACHGLKGMGTEQGPPLVHIIYQPSHHADEAFRRAVALGSVAHHWSFGSMPAQPGVSPEEVEAIIRYVRWLQTRAGIT